MPSLTIPCCCSNKVLLRAMNMRVFIRLIRNLTWIYDSGVYRALYCSGGLYGDFQRLSWFQGILSL